MLYIVFTALFTISNADFGIHELVKNGCLSPNRWYSKRSFVSILNVSSTKKRLRKMYIPKINTATDKGEILEFMKRYSFATLITAKDNFPTATHLPFVVNTEGDNVVLTSHFAKANDHWQDLEDHPVLVIFSEPHAYISPKNYVTELNVPTWNYVAIHIYGTGKIIRDRKRTFEILEASIDNFESSFRLNWDSFPEDYKLKMSNNVVGFEILVNEIQAKKKLSQNRTESEQRNIIDALSTSKDTNERVIAEYMKKNIKYH